MGRLEVEELTRTTVTVGARWTERRRRRRLPDLLEQLRHQVAAELQLALEQVIALQAERMTTVHGRRRHARVVVRVWYV